MGAPNLIELYRKLTPEQRLEAYGKAHQTGDEQTKSAIELADATVKLRHLPSMERCGRLYEEKIPDGSGRIITKYHGDPRVWRNKFTAPGIPVLIERPAVILRRQ